jgi:hypothetical protein
MAIWCRRPNPAHGVRSPKNIAGNKKSGGIAAALCCRRAVRLVTDAEEPEQDDQAEWYAQQPEQDQDHVLITSCC